MSKILKLSSLNDFKSIDTAKIIIIKIGAEWCIPCKTTYPNASALCTSVQALSYAFAA